MPIISCVLIIGVVENFVDLYIQGVTFNKLISNIKSIIPCYPKKKKKKTTQTFETTIDVFLK